MKNLLAILILFWFVATSQAQAPSAVHCTVNAKAGRAFAEDIGWYGPIPERDENPDASKPFDVIVGLTDPEGVLFHEFIFSQLDTDHPHVRPIRHKKYAALGSIYEREATVIQRTPSAVFFSWRGVLAQEVYTAVIHWKSLKAAIGKTGFSDAFPGVVVEGITADCQ